MTKLERDIERRIKRSRGVRRAFDRIVDRVLETVVALSPVESGEYRASHQKREMPEVDGLPSARVGSDDDKARIIEYGSDAEDREQGGDSPEFGVYRKAAAMFR